MITVQDLKDRFGEREIISLTDTKNYAVLNEKKAQTACADAVREIMGYLRAAGLVLPNGELVSLAPKVVDEMKDKLSDIARYELYENGTTPTVEKRRDDAIAWFKMVMKNPVMLTGKSDSGTSAGGTNASAGVVVMPNPVPTIWDN